MSRVFDAYARYYDLLYRNKDYAGEAEYVASHIRQHSPDAIRILELGCGTGGHAEHLARMGYSVHGVDLSEGMIAGAEARKATLPAKVAARMSLGVGDVRTVRKGATYDAVISLFHVMSYQTSNTDVLSTLDAAANHLNIGGLLIFDFWYGPAVLTQRPEVRVKRLVDDNVRVTRIAEPQWRPRECVVDVNYQVWLEDIQTSLVKQFDEKHSMRYFFEPELDLLLERAGFSRTVSYGWLESTPPSPDHWSAVIVAMRE